MDTQPISEYFHFGLDFWYLRQAEAGFPIHDKSDVDLSFVLTSIKDFLSSLDSLNLKVTRNAAQKLVKFQKLLESGETDSQLDKKQAEQLQEIMGELGNTLLAELQGLNVYVVTDKRLNVANLQNKVHLLFAPNVFQKLPTLAQYDISEAGKCIAFERSTAAAFHLMRATESVLREYYCFLVSRNRVKILLWGAITKDLQNRRKFQKDEKRQTLFKNLDNIRVSFRNPTINGIP